MICPTCGIGRVDWHSFWAGFAAAGFTSLIGTLILLAVFHG